MDLDNVYVVDIECNSLLPNLRKLHILSLGWKNSEGKWQIKSTNKKEDIEKIFSNPKNTVVGHFFLGFDIRAIKKLFPDIDVQASIIDTLPLSQYLYNERPSHGLEAWGDFFNFPKTKISDDEWENMSYERAEERCVPDVQINIMLWEKCLKLLRELYGSDEAIIPVLKRANFKIILQSIQDENKVLVDIPKCKKNLEYLQGIIAEKEKELNAIMPKIPIKSTKSKPKVLYKKDGTLSEAGKKWFELVKNCNLPEDYEGQIDVITGYEEPNCQSTKQMKDFLFLNNWKPLLFKDGANGKVPQLRDDEKNLCKSIIQLIDKNPNLKALDGLSVAQHRAGYLKAFLDCADENGYITASWSGLAKTWRVKHIKPIVNLPSNNSQYGDLVRSCLIAPEGKVFVNADLSSLEDKTKQVAIYPIDPKYVETLNTKGYDAHLAIALKAGFMSQEDVDFFKWYKKEDRKEEECPEAYKIYSETEKSEQFVRLSKIRQTAKTTNYAATYKASAKKIAETADIPLKEAKIFHSGYWEINHSIKIFEDSLEVKEVDGKKWMYSPYTKLWLYLSSDHLKFSAFNQNFGSCVFDLFTYYLIEGGLMPIFSIHDETNLYINKGEEEKTKKIIQEAMDKVNKAYNYPIKFESNPEFAQSYGDVH